MVLAQWMISAWRRCAWPWHLLAFRILSLLGFARSLTVAVLSEPSRRLQPEAQF
jgi:hypothetical protein